MATTTSKESTIKPQTATQDVTIDGITVTVAADVFDDFELVMDLSELNEGNPLKIAPVFTRLLGKDQTSTVLNALRDPKTGRVSVEKGTTFIVSLMKELAPNS